LSLHSKKARPYFKIKINDLMFKTTLLTKHQTSEILGYCSQKFIAQQNFFFNNKTVQKLEADI